MGKSLKYVDGCVVANTVRISSEQINELRAGSPVYLPCGGTNIMGEGLVVEIKPPKAKN